MKNQYFLLIFIFSFLCFLLIGCSIRGGGEKVTRIDGGDEGTVIIESAEITNLKQISIDGIVSSGLVNKNPNAKLDLYEMATYENIEEHIYEQNPISTINLKDQFSFAIDLMDGDRSRLYSKFIVVLNSDEKDIAISNIRYITNPEEIAVNDYPFPQAKSKKGLQVKGDMTGDAEELGISHAALNVAYNEMLYKDEENSVKHNTIPYEFQGETFYFKKDRIEKLDYEVKALSNNNVIISLILLMYYDLSTNTPNSDIIHPDHEVVDGATVYALNTTNEQGVKYVKAITNFIAERYTRDDEKYGRAVNFIVGNEIGQNKIWNNMGQKVLTDYVLEYARTLRLIETIVKSNYAQARTYVSLDHFWNEKLPEDSLWKYDNKEIVDLLTEHIRSEGDIPWNIAFHPYPEDLFNPKFWEDQTPTNDMENTPRITFKNLEVLVNYMKQDKMLFAGEMRRIILSEQGLNDRNHSIESQRNQAAAYAYAYYKTKFLEGIDSFILHRHVDHAQEYGLNLGLWTIVDGTVTTAEDKKYVYDVFKYIDTERSLEVAEFAKDIIGINKWEDVIDDFDASQLADRNLPNFIGMDFIEKTLHSTVLEGFEDGIGGWTPADNATSLGISSDAINGNGSLQVNFDAPANLWRGADLKFDKPLDASNKPNLNLALKVPVFEEMNEYLLKVKVYDKLDYAEGIASFDPKHGWIKVSLNLDTWDGVGSIDRIKVWIKSSTTNRWIGNFLIDQVEISSDVVPIGNQSNFSIETREKANHLEVGEDIELTIKNNSSKVLNGNIQIEPSDIITFDQKHLKLGKLSPGDRKTFSLIIDEFNPLEEGPIFIDFKYRGIIIKKNIGKYEKVNENIILFDFEEDINGWSPGENVVDIIKVDEFLNAPGVPHSGTYALSAKAKNVPANSWKTIKFKSDQLLNLEGAKNFYYHINSYGGVPNATYETKLTFISGTDVFSITEQINADQWNEIRVNIEDLEFKNEITALEISFRAVGNDMDWGPEFQVDLIGFESEDPMD